MKLYPISKVKVSTWIFAVFMFLNGTNAAETPSMDDESIVRAVEEEILFDETVPFNDIDIEVKDGIVYLDGRVTNLLAKERATMVATTVKGVRAVANRVEVRPFIKRSERDLEVDVRNAFAADSVVESYEITVDADKSGTVTLEGYADSWQEKNFAGSVAAGVKGVTSINNNIQAIPKINRPNDQIRTEILKRLEWDTLVDNSLIAVSVDNGIVNLSGVVGSAAEKHQAQLDAWVSGVRDVDSSELMVDRWKRDEDLRRDKYVTRTDLEISDAIEDAFTYDPRVFVFSITPHVTHGWVTLRGQVNNLRAKAAAVNIAKHTVGVTGVTDRIKVRAEFQPSDKELTQTVEDVLARDVWLSSKTIDLVVENGIARISGTVGSTFEKIHLESLLSGISGIKEVKNYVHVADPDSVTIYDPYIWDYYPYPWIYKDPYMRNVSAEIYGHTKSDEKTARDIATQLYWSPFVDHDDITVLVEDGVATLVGKVSTKNEKQIAETNALQAGAKEVENDLIVES